MHNAASNVHYLPSSNQQPQTAPLYELYWRSKSSSTPCCIASRDPGRILRQMNSLADRGIASTVLADGRQAGHAQAVNNEGKCLVFFPAAHRHRS